jgi:hypothetical protein
MGKTSSPGLVISGGVTITGVPEIVVVKGGGLIGRIGVGGGTIVQGTRQDTVGFGTSQIHGGRGTRLGGWSRSPGRLSPAHPTIVPKKPSMLLIARMSATWAP